MASSLSKLYSALMASSPPLILSVMRSIDKSSLGDCVRSLSLCVYISRYSSIHARLIVTPTM